MASSATVALAIIVVVLSIAVQSARGAGLACEELPPDVCAFAVSSAGRRCVLERTPEGAPRCQASALGVRALSSWVETDACVRACGVDRDALGLPVVAGDNRRLFRALCSPACLNGCPNIVDLYATLAAGEGGSLPALCDALMNVGTGYRRMMAEMSPLGAPVAAPDAAPAPM